MLVLENFAHEEKQKQYHSGNPSEYALTFRTRCFVLCGASRCLEHTNDQDTAWRGLLGELLRGEMLDYASKAKFGVREWINAGNFE